MPPAQRTFLNAAGYRGADVAQRRSFLNYKARTAQSDIAMRAQAYRSTTPRAAFGFDT